VSSVRRVCACLCFYMSVRVSLCVFACECEWESLFMCESERLSVRARECECLRASVSVRASACERLLVSMMSAYV
jgi:hypothetical protein